MPPPPSNAPRPGRLLIALLIIVIAMIGAMFAKGAWTPKLGLDLSGGTTVTLHPVTQSGKEPPTENVDKAVSIIRERVNAFGVSEAEVTRQGANIIVAVPGQGQREVVEQVGQTAQLRFRQVLLFAPTDKPLPTQTPSPNNENGQGDGKGPGSTKQESGDSKPRVVTPGLLNKAEPRSKNDDSKSGRRDAGQRSTDGSAGGDLASRLSALGDTSGIDPKVLRQFQQLDCTKHDRGQEALDDPDEQLAACDQNGRGKYILAPAKVLGTMISNARAGLPQTSAGAEWLVQLTFDNTGTSRFGDLTQRVVNLPPPRNQVAIVLDGDVVSAPQIQQPILNGEAQIEGNFTQQRAQNLADVLRFGALPLKFEKSTIEEISPTLGTDSLRGGLLAGALGLVLVGLYCMLYYRGLGSVVIVSLAIAAILTYASVVLLGAYIGYRLSLAGVAGLIVAIGITADSFVVFFERLRDEVRDGRSLRSAVERGWLRARRTIITADFVSFLAAVVLWIVAVGNVKGFAFTLGLTTWIDVIVVFLFTKPLLTILARTRFFGGGHPLSGLDPRRLGARTPRVVPAGGRAALSRNRPNRRTPREA